MKDINQLHSEHAELNDERITIIAQYDTARTPQARYIYRASLNLPPIRLHRLIALRRLLKDCLRV